MDTFEAKRKRLEAAKEAVARNQGAYDQMMASLMEYGITTLEEAQALYERHKKNDEVMAVELSHLMAEFEELTHDL